MASPLKPATCETKGRHDPCIVRRAGPDVEAVTASALADAILAEWRAAQKDFDPTNAPEWVKEDMAMMDLLMEAFELRIKGEHHLLMAKVGPRYRALWLKQNRRGGLESSLLQLFSK